MLDNPDLEYLFERYAAFRRVQLRDRRPVTFDLYIQNPSYYDASAARTLRDWHDCPRVILSGCPVIIPN